MDEETQKNENQITDISVLDASILKSLRELEPSFKVSVDKLGVVLEDLVNMLDLDGSGIDVYILQYVADARQSLRVILQLLDNPKPETNEAD